MAIRVGAWSTRSRPCRTCRTGNDEPKLLIGRTATRVGPIFPRRASTGSNSASGLAIRQSLARPPATYAAGDGIADTGGFVNAAVVDDAEMLLAAVAAWARPRPDIAAALVVGSRARVVVPADRWSDIDIVLMVDDPTAYAADAGWLATFGRPLLTFTEATAVGGFIERRVLFDTGQDADFSLVPVASAERVADHPDAAAVFGRGFRVLVDKVDLECALRGCGPPAPAPPDACAFEHLTHDFWYHALWTAKKLRRGETWIAKQSCDCHLKALTVRLLAWRAQAIHPDIDTWHGGRFLEQWADQRALHDLRDAYAGYDADDVARALWSTVNLSNESSVSAPSASTCRSPLSTTTSANFCVRYFRNVRS